MNDKALLASENMVSRLAKVLNQAERAEDGSPEREAFMAKAMQLSQAYSIDLAVARAHQAQKEKREEPERRTFTVGSHTGRYRKAVNAHFVDLMIAICDANDIEVTISHSRKFVFGTGMPSDLDMAERLFAILSVQMVQEADAGIKAGANGKVQLAPKYRREQIPEDERAWGQHDDRVNHYTDITYFDEKDEEYDDLGRRQRFNEVTQQYDWVRANPPPSTRLVQVYDDDGKPVMEEKWVATTDAPTWRANFYQGFIMRTRMRLREAKAQALKNAGIDPKDTTDDKAIALRDKAKEVREAFEENEKYVLSHGGTYGGANVTNYSHDGRLAGDDAGQRARLGNEKDIDRG